MWIFFSGFFIYEKIYKNIKIMWEMKYQMQYYFDINMYLFIGPSQAVECFS